MTHNTEQSEPPSLADIVRQETDNGRTIVRFYLDVANGKLDDEGFEACHRVEAAMQVQAIAPEVVADAITRLAGVQCHPERRGKRPTRRSRAVGNPSQDADRSSAARRHEALEYLASALAAPSLADDPRVAGIVRESTDQGKTVVSFLLHVMHGVVRGFRPRQRVEAAKELLAHIARDEIARSGSLTPSPSTGEGWGEGEEGRNLQAGSHGQARLTVIPAEACPVPRYGAGIQDDLTVVPAQAGTQGDGEGEALPSDHPEADDQEDPESQRGCYDIDGKIAEAQRDPAHPIHKFVQAYDEVAAVFHGEDNDDDEEVRYWISGEVPDAYGKYIWEYAPAYPKSIRRRLRPRRRRRSREPGTTPKAESIWMKRPSDRMREEGIPKPKRTLIWV